MKRIVAAVGLCLLLSGGATVFAFRAPANRSISHYDKRWAHHPVDRFRPPPNFVGDPNGFLPGPNGQGKGVSPRMAAAIPAGDKHYAIKGFLKEHAALFGHGPEVLNSARVQRDYTTPHNGMQTTIWQQQLDDIDVFEAVLMAHVTAQGELV